MKITVPIELPAARIANLMCGVMEGNAMTRAWCSAINLVSDEPEKHDDDKGIHWYASRNLYETDFVIEVQEIEDEKTGEVKKHKVTREQFERGLVLMATKDPQQFANILADDDDAVTVDVMMQYIVLGEIIYG